jgi:hypothetical protein
MGNPHWLVDDTYYQGWGKVKSVDLKSGRIRFEPYRFGVPKLSAGSVVVRSGHANSKSFEFMDAEFKQWEMQGETVANAGPYYMQHGNWRVEVEPLEHKKEDVFLHVMLPCDTASLEKSKMGLRENVVYSGEGDSLKIELKGANRTYMVVFNEKTTDLQVKVFESGKLIHDSLQTDNTKKKK